MANSRTMMELRREGFIVAECDRHQGPFTKDLYGFGDVFAYDPLHLRRPRIVNGCLEDIHLHIRKYLEGDIEQPENPRFGPNKHLIHLINYFDLYIYSHVLRTFKTVDEKRSKRKVYECRKWKAIVSPEGKMSFEREEK